MRWIVRRIFSVLLICCLVMSITVSLAGCKKSDYEQWKKEEAERLESQAQIWFYGNEYDTWRDVIQYYNVHYDPDVTAVQFKEHEIDFDQFSTKLQAAIMTGSGPDLVLTQNRNLLSDIRKTIQAGAFAPLDEVVAEWDAADYYPQMVESCRHSDGKIYYLPLSIQYQMIVTTQENLDAYGLTADDFSDFEKYTEQVLRFWEGFEPGVTPYADCGMPMLFMMIPELMEYETRSTALCTDQTQKLIDRWSKIRRLQKQHRLAHSNVYETEEGYIVGQSSVNVKNLLLGEQVFGTDIPEGLSIYDVEIGEYIYLTEEQKEQLVLFPLRDTEGMPVAEVFGFLAVPAQSKHKDTIKQLIDVILLEEDCVNHQMIGISRYHTQKAMRDSLSAFTDLERIFEEPVRICHWNDVWNDFEAELRLELSKEQPDYSDLEQELNIYLSE